MVSHDNRKSNSVGNRVGIVARKYKAYAIVGTFVAVFWSWMLFMNVAIISKNTIVATVLAWFAFILIVVINTTIYTKVIKYLALQPVAALTFIKGIFIWAFTEWCTAWVLSFVWFGKGGSVDTLFPFASFSAFLAYTPLAYSARFLGYYGLSSLFVGVIIVTLVPKFKTFRVPIYGVCVTLTLLGWLLYKNPTGPAIQTTIVSEYLRQHQKIESISDDLVVLPEYGLDGITSQTLDQRFAGGLPRSFVGSQQEAVDSGQVRNVFIYGNKTGYDMKVDKSRLIAGGEYLPFLFEGILTLTNHGKEIENFHKVRGVVKGPEHLVPYRVSNEISIGGAVCSSIISTEDYRKLTVQGATVLTNSASLGIFTGSKVFNIQHGGFARFMATANARPFLQSSSYGPAFALDHNGKEIKRINPINYTHVTVLTNKRTTPYSVLGEWTVYIGAVVLLGALCRRIYSLLG